ncbi:MAG: glycosyltransferase family 4 protein, partial [Chloroflexota bacterium]
LGIPAERVFVAYNAAAPKPTSPPPKRAKTFTGKPTILFVGRLQARKRLNILLHACANQPEDLKPELLIVGDGPARGEFESQAQGIYPATQFLGARFGSALDSIFAEADIFILPGTGGLAVQQAMSHGLPIIVAEGDGTQADLVRPNNGWLVPPDDQTALNNTIRIALRDPAKLREMGAESYRITAEEINLENMVNVFIKALVQTKRK